MKKRGFFPAYLLSLMLWFMFSLPGDELNMVQESPKNIWLRLFLSDPFMHFLVFGLLTLLVCRGFYRETSQIPFALVGLLVSGYGLAMELYQGLLPWRSFGLDDLLWNTMGVLVFLTIVWGWVSLILFMKKTV